MTPTAEVQQRVLRRIQNAWPNAIRKTDCAPISPRTFEAAVRELRLAGHPISSDGDGYAWATTPHELRATADGLLRRISHVAETRDALIETAKRMELAAVPATAPSLWDEPEPIDREGEPAFNGAFRSW
jgi:hypothetical protein